MNRSVNVCFVAHSSYAEMTGGRGGEIGGIQRQQAFMAKWFAVRGHQVTMLTFDEGQPDDQVIDGVRIIKLFRKDAGVPGVRFLHPRWTGLRWALARAGAEVYYHNTAEYVTGQVALWCRGHGRRFVFSTAHDANCDVRLPNLASSYERVLYRYGLLHADKIVTQTLKQHLMLEQGFKRDSVIIPMPCPVSPFPPRTWLQRAEPRRVLWVGRVVPYKRLEIFLDIAERAPELMFDVAGVPNEGSEYGRRAIYRASAMPNVTLHGRVPRERIPELYRQALCLCCTSTQEGFPNTFLEAWSEGTPLVTTFDPDNVVASRGLGDVGNDAEALLSAIRRLATSDSDWTLASAHAHRHFTETHDPEVVMPQFERVFQDAASRAK